MNNVTQASAGNWEIRLISHIVDEIRRAHKPACLNNSQVPCPVATLPNLNITFGTKLNFMCTGERNLHAHEKII